MERTLVIGTRGSRLALWQAHTVQAGLAGPSRIHVIHTSGDRFTEASLGEQGGAGFFTREIEEDLAASRIDLAVHSLKDLPVQLPPGMAFGAILPREAVNDVLLVRPEALDPNRSFPVRPGLRVGTSAHRRRALLTRFRPDLVPIPLRGNVPTRVEKALRGDCDALILARAGLVRLGHDPRPLVAFDLDPACWLPAPGQAAVAVEIRAGDTEVFDRLAALRCDRTARAVTLERQLLKTSGGGCHSAFSAWASEGGDGVTLRVGMPARGGPFAIRAFHGDTLEAARTRAEAWVLDAASDGGDATDAPLCTPARPWTLSA